MLPSPIDAAKSAKARTDRPAAAPVTLALAPRGIERLHRIRGDLRMGLPVVLEDGGASVLVALVETLTAARFAAMTSLGQPGLVLTRRRAEALSARVPIKGDTLRLAVPAGVDLGWLIAATGQAGLDVGAAAPDLPTLQAGTSIDQTAIEIAKSVKAVPAVLTLPLSLRDNGTISGLGLTTMPLALVTEALEQSRVQSRVSSARLPMDSSPAGRVHVFRPDDGGAEHYAIEIGAPDLSGPVTVRLHSACFTGDVLGSLKCDCGPQLRAAMAAMAKDGGVLLYLNQEGRGIGLANKMRAYALQDTGLDTVEANHWLGFEDDQRDFRIGAQILRRMGIDKVRLMTNNPAKMASVAAQGIEVLERVPLRVGQTTQNAHYLATKAAKSGHLL